jgi:5-methylcytosine-specific restriction endonuclease McrA
VDRFSLHPNAPDGRQSRCHDCCSARLKGYWPGNYQKNKAKKLAVAKKWREEHPEACRSGKRRRYAESPWAVKAEQHARRAMKMGNGGDGVSPEDWRLIVDEYSGRCAYCLAIMGSVSMDHVIPLVRGGEHSTGNVVPACRSCNSSKHDHGMIDLLMRPHLLVTQRMLAASQ